MLSIIGSIRKIEIKALSSNHGTSFDGEGRIKFPWTFPEVVFEGFPESFSVLAYAPLFDFFPSMLVVSHFFCLIDPKSECIYLLEGVVIGIGAGTSSESRTWVLLSREYLFMDGGILEIPIVHMQDSIIVSELSVGLIAVTRPFVAIDIVVNELGHAELQQYYIQWLINYLMTVRLLITISLAVLASAIRPVYRCIFQEDEPINLRLRIFNSTFHTVSQYEYGFLYSSNTPEHLAQLSFPLGPTIGNYSIEGNLYKENKAQPVFTITKNLTRYAKIRKNSTSSDALMMEADAMSTKEDPDAQYGLHIPTKFSLLVLHQQGELPSIENFKHLCNFKTTRARGNEVLYIPPIDMSQLMIPYKTYKSVQSLEQGLYNMTISIKVYSATYFTIFYGFTRPDLMKQANPLFAEMYSDEMMDMIKESIFTNNFYLVLTYFILSFIQIFMNIFAFKNEIETWKKVQQKGGLSIKVLYQNLLFELIICLYLLDKEANKLYIFFSFLSLVLTVWKIFRAVQITKSPSFPFLSIGYKSWYQRKTLSVDSNAVHYTSYLTVVFFLLFLVYKLYSFWASGAQWHIPSPRAAYSLGLDLSVGFIFVFGFVLMTPQLYINYKLKSVDHLPWKTLFYRFVSTIIDDVFVFMIDLPTMQRMLSFRDDVIFILYLYQRWIYRVDPNRKALIGGGSTTQSQAEVKSLKSD